MTLWIILAIFIPIDLLVVGSILYGTIHVAWNGFAEKHPPRPIADDAVRRRRQSFKLGVLNLGWSLHVAVDDACLHLEPVRWLARIGMKPASVPWDAITPQGRVFGGRAKVRIGHETLIGPRWCLELAAPPDDPGEPEDSRGILPP